MKRQQSMLAAAIERKDWDAVAVLLMDAYLTVARMIPRETLEALIDELSAEADATDCPRAKRRRDRG